MERLLARLERRYGRYALHGITWYLVGIQALVFVLELTNPGFVQMLVLDRDAVMRGQVWRLVTYLFIPPSQSPIWVLFALYWLYLIGVTLEAEWGSFKYQLYLLLGMVLTTASAFVFRVAADNMYLMMSLFLAFATLYPDYQIMLFFVLPIRVKWLALLDGVLILAAIGTLGGMHKLIPIVAVGNYLIFFHDTLMRQVKSGAFRAKRAGEFVANKRKVERDPETRRRCAKCGVDDSDPNIDFRVCTCERCGKPTEFCLDHARNH